MIRNVCIHVANEQPLLCDLFAIPTAADAGLVCTNVRSLDGKRPVFIDHVTSTFFFPYHIVRFLEIPEQSMAEFRAAGGRLDGRPAAAHGPEDQSGHDDGVAGLARGNGHGDAADVPSLLPVAVGVPDAVGDDDLDLDLELDEDFLKRVRDI